MIFHDSDKEPKSDSNEATANNQSENDGKFYRYHIFPAIHRHGCPDCRLMVRIFFGPDRAAMFIGFVPGINRLF